MTLLDEARVRPMIGQWYLDLANEQQFKVVARDEDSIEVQYLDGGVAAYDGEEWQCLDIALTAAPEDWSGALEPVEDGDGGYDPESFEPPADQRPPTGFGQDQILLADEADAREAQEAPGSDDEEE